MKPAVNDGIVRYTILDETGPDRVLLFGCEGHPEKKLTSYMLETHMRTQHEARRFTVSVPSPVPDLDEVKNAGTIIAMSENLSKALKEGPENTELTSPARKERQRYNRPVPGPRQPRQG